MTDEMIAATDTKQTLRVEWREGTYLARSWPRWETHNWQARVVLPDGEQLLLVRECLGDDRRPGTHWFIITDRPIGRSLNWWCLNYDGDGYYQSPNNFLTSLYARQPLGREAVELLYTAWRLTV